MEGRKSSPSREGEGQGAAGVRELDLEGVQDPSRT